ncbi:hypothetical protein P8452_23588 [Trifolium repens]|nr:hypothetical protein P8452_23588 [Trifolium repens]
MVLPCHIPTLTIHFLVLTLCLDQWFQLELKLEVTLIPGYEIDLDSLVQDALRLNSAIKDTCSESCEKSEGTILYATAQREALFDKRWSRVKTIGTKEKH